MAAARDELTQAPRGVCGQSALTLAAGAGSDFRRVKSDQAVDDPAHADGIAVDLLHGAWVDRSLKLGAVAANEAARIARRRTMRSHLVRSRIAGGPAPVRRL
jgi:hypothetical protein